jgi:deferrochelatase/peroxidase EfeB
LNVSRATALAALSLLAIVPAVAQDIRGLEVCTAEKQMERRTGCLQANNEFLQQALAKLARETQAKMATAAADVAAARAEIAALKSALAKFKDEMAQLKSKAEPAAKKQ